MAKCKVLKTGETDIESTDIWRFCIHSDYPTQKIYAAGQTTLTISAGNNYGSKIISHDLEYAPIVMAMFETNNGRFVKVFGETKAIISAQITQYFAVSSILNYITGRVNDDHGGVTTNSYVSINDIIQFRSGPRNGGILPSPLQPNTNYYVKSIIDSENFKISLTQGGSEIDITDGGGFYGDIFKNITNPRIVDIDLIYSIDTTDSTVTFNCNPSIDTPLFENDTDITIYYIILYEEI